MYKFDLSVACAIENARESVMAALEGYDVRVDLLTVGPAKDDVCGFPVVPVETDDYDAAREAMLAWWPGCDENHLEELLREAQRAALPLPPGTPLFNILYVRERSNAPKIILAEENGKLTLRVGSKLAYRE